MTTICVEDAVWWRKEEVIANKFSFLRLCDQFVSSPRSSVDFPWCVCSGDAKYLWWFRDLFLPCKFSFQSNPCLTIDQNLISKPRSYATLLLTNFSTASYAKNLFLFSLPCQPHICPPIKTLSFLFCFVSMSNSRLLYELSYCICDNAALFASVRSFDCRSAARIAARCCCTNAFDASVNQRIKRVLTFSASSRSCLRGR